MKTCVIYVSHTGNTKRLAETIAETLKVPIINVTTASPNDVAEFDLLIAGTPVIGLKPAPEILSFIDSLPETEGKRAILFCTYAFMKGSAPKVMEEKLGFKGYRTVLKVDKRGVKPGKADFDDVLDRVEKAVNEQCLL